MGSGRPLEGGNQMQRKHERFLEEDQLQVGVWVPRAVYGAAKLKVSASLGPSVFAPPAPARCCPLRCCVLLLQATAWTPMPQAESGHWFLVTLVGGAWLPWQAREARSSLQEPDCWGRKQVWITSHPHASA